MPRFPLATPLLAMIEFSCQAIDALLLCCYRRGMASDREVAAHFRLVVKRRAVEAGDDAALVHHVAALRHGADHVEILLDQDDGYTGPAVKLDHVACDVLDDVRLDAFGRLIEQNEIGIGNQHTPDRKLLLLAAGHGPGALAPALSEDRESFHDPPPSCLGIPPLMAAPTAMVSATVRRRNTSRP